MDNFSSLRHKALPALPHILQDLKRLHAIPRQEGLSSALSQYFPLTGKNLPVAFALGKERMTRPRRAGVIFSGGQAAGGHNVIAGLFDALKQLHSESALLGFLGGPSGLIDNKFLKITAELVDRYRNQGGFDLIGSGRTKISSEEQFKAVINTVSHHHLDGLVIIGGDDSNTNAALLSEKMKQESMNVSVVGVPKTIDGDLKNKQIETSFGFDTATKTFSHSIGSLQRDALSAGKYYFFIKLMGRSASHIALECALQTHPNYTLIGEEVALKQQTLKLICNEITDMICKRAELGKHYGVILIPEGVIEFIPEVKSLIEELNRLLVPELSYHQEIEKLEYPEEKSKRVSALLSSAAAECFNSIPLEIRMQLIMDRDPHGNVQVAKIETERLFIQMVSAELKRRSYKGKFSPQALFLGYEGRSCYPSVFDANYCYALGQTAGLLIDTEASGYMAVVNGLAGAVADWQISGEPLASMMALEERYGKQVPVIAKALVDLAGGAFALFDSQREGWKIQDDYRYPGPIQFFGPHELTEATAITLQADSHSIRRH